MKLNSESILVAPENSKNSEISELDFFSFFEMTPDLVCIASKEGFFKKVNPAVIAKLGYTIEELFARPISSFIHPADRHLTASTRENMLGGKALINFENRYITKNGTIVWLEWTSIYLPNKEVVFAIAKEVTQRKNVEKEIEQKYQKFKGLANHFKGSIEEDRKYLATELHEELAQIASAVKMDVDWIARNIADLSAPVLDRITRIQTISEMLINSIRRISFSISPNMLEMMGLNATLSWLCQDFSILNGITCTFKEKCNENLLGNEMKIDFFRICQEALMNVLSHAKASHVAVNIESIGNKVVLTIVDDGVGFNVAEQTNTNGLIAMHKRATSINSDLTVQSEPGKGTRVCLTAVSIA